MRRGIDSYLDAAAKAGSRGARQVVPGVGEEQLSAAAEQLGIEALPSEVAAWWRVQNGAPGPYPLPHGDLLGLGHPVSLEYALAESAEIALCFSDPDPFPVVRPLLIAMSYAPSWSMVECGGDDAGAVWNVSQNGVHRLFDSIGDMVECALQVLDLGWVHFEDGGDIGFVSPRWPDRAPVWPDPATPEVMIGQRACRPLDPDLRG